MSILQLGLFLNIAGTIIIFFYGFPSKIEPDNSSGFFSTGDLSEEEDNLRLRKNLRIKRFGYFGITLLIVGFILQFIDTIK